MSHVCFLFVIENILAYAHCAGLWDAESSEINAMKTVRTFLREIIGAEPAGRMLNFITPAFIHGKNARSVRCGAHNFPPLGRPGTAAAG
jgi:hypothetical protein